MFENVKALLTHCVGGEPPMSPKISPCVIKNCYLINNPCRDSAESCLLCLGFFSVGHTIRSATILRATSAGDMTSALLRVGGHVRRHLHLSPFSPNIAASH